MAMGLLIQRFALFTSVPKGDMLHLNLRRLDPHSRDALVRDDVHPTKV
jgi:hypothetical protein